MATVPLGASVKRAIVQLTKSMAIELARKSDLVFLDHPTSIRALSEL
jgi:hypothetical protein